MPSEPGKVTVTTDYQPGVAITVTIANGLDRPLYTEDFKTACTIVLLQRRDGETWIDITGCRLGRPTLTVTIGPGLGRMVDIDPRSFHLTDSPVGPGTYRVKFTYRLDPGATGDEPLVAYSAEFTIR